MNSHATQAESEDLLQDMKLRVVAKLRALGVPKEEADKAAKSLYRDLVHHWGGQQVYIKKLDRGLLPDRDLALYEKFNGSNHQALAREYQISVQRVYDIIKLVHQYQVNKRQHSLFKSPHDES